MLTKIASLIVGIFIVTIVVVMVCSMLNGCGNMSGGSVTDAACGGVDTSRAPDTVIVGPDFTTYTWGNCTKTYYNH